MEIENIRTLSFLKKLNGKNNGIFKQFIDDNRENEQIQLAFYPSSNRDFRALLYLSDGFRNDVQPQLNQLTTPDLFIYCDYMPDNDDNWVDQKVLFQDENTTIKVVEYERLSKLNESTNLSSLIQTKMVTGSTKVKWANSVVFFNLEIQSKQLGTFYKPLLFVFSVNEYFFRYYILKYLPTVSHVIKIRYGSGLFGGSNTTGLWLRHVLKVMNTKYFISDDQTNYHSADKLFLNLYLRGKFNDSDRNINLREFHRIPSHLWSRYGDISYYQVKEKTNIPPKFERFPWKISYSNDTKHLIASLIDKITNYFSIRFSTEKGSLGKLLNANWATLCLEILEGGGFSKELPLSEIPTETVDQLMDECNYQRILTESVGNIQGYRQLTEIQKFTYQNDKGGLVDMYVLKPDSTTATI